MSPPGGSLNVTYPIRVAYTAVQLGLLVHFNIYAIRCTIVYADPSTLCTDLSGSLGLVLKVSLGKSAAYDMIIC